MARFFDASIPNPAKPDEPIQVRAWQRLHSFDHGSKRAAVIWEYYRRDAWATPGAVPIHSETYKVEADEQPAVYGQPVMLTEAVPPVYGEVDPESGEAELITPGVEAKFGPGEMIRPRIPGYNELFGELASAVAAIGERFTSLAADYYGGSPVVEG